MTKPKLPYFGNVARRRGPSEKVQTAGREEDPGGEGLRGAGRGGRARRGTRRRLAAASPPGVAPEHASQSAASFTLSEFRWKPLRREQDGPRTLAGSYFIRVTGRAPGRRPRAPSPLPAVPRRASSRGPPSGPFWFRLRRARFSR